jgi:hypothetical protein
MLVQNAPWLPLGGLCNIVQREEEEAQGVAVDRKGVSKKTCLKITVQCSVMSKRASEPR